MKIRGLLVRTALALAALGLTWFLVAIVPRGPLNDHAAAAAHMPLTLAPWGISLLVHSVLSP